MDEPADRDLALVRSALAGDPDAFGELVGRHQRLVTGVAWRYGCRAEEIEDVVSEVFVKVWRGLGRYRPDHPFSTWLYRLAANHVIDRTRRARGERRREELDDRVADRSPGPDEALALRERREIVREALAAISPPYRDALFAVYVEGMKVEDAARLLGLPSGTIKTRLMRGREALRRLLVRRHPALFGG